MFTDRDGFASVEIKSDAVEYTINNDPTSPQSIVSSNIIDLERLHVFEQRTKVAQDLLSNIFNEEEPADSQNITKAGPSRSWIEVFKTLLTKDTWNREEVDYLCKERGLLIGAVLEQINDFAFEKVNDDVIIYVIADYKELLI